jgi:hypothetical protein
MFARASCGAVQHVSFGFGAVGSDLSWQVSNHTRAGTVPDRRGRCGMYLVGFRHAMAGQGPSGRRWA